MVAKIKNPVGTDSNASGLKAEASLALELESLGYKIRTRYLLPEALGKAIHGAGSTVSLFILPCAIFKNGLAIDVSSQERPGTVYQKVPFKVLTIHGWNIPGVIVVNGDGGSMPAMRDWAASQVANPTTLALPEKGLWFVGTSEEFVKALRLHGLSIPPF